MSLLPVEGRIEIRLTVREARISRVEIRNQRLLSLTRGLIGQPAEQAPRRLAGLFSLCRVAQTLAAVQAVEQAAGLPPSAARTVAHRFLLCGETLLEHASRAALDWPPLAGEAPLLPLVKRLRRALADLPQRLFPDGESARPGGGRLRIRRDEILSGLSDVAQALEIHDFLPPLAVADWEPWLAAGTGVPSRFLAGLVRRDMADWGACPVAPLPAWTPRELRQRLVGDDETRFLRQPDWRGAVHETGPLARQDGQPLLAALIARHGGGLLARFAARLLEMARVLREMRDLAETLCDDDGTEIGLFSGEGLGVVEAARGRLLHRLVVKNGTVTQYQILAPTEWNFHPAGALVQGLEGRPATADPLAQTRLLVAALDPCVGYQVELAS